MTTTLEAMVAAWMGGEPGSGPALHDLLEECGWEALKWRDDDSFTKGYSHLWVGGYAVAYVREPDGSRTVRGGWLKWRTELNRPSWEPRWRNYYGSQEAAKKGAEEAFRRALRGGQTP